MNLASYLLSQAQRRPSAPAIVDWVAGRRRVCTFAALDARSARGAAQLARSGLQQGDAVLLLQPMSAELYIVLAALLRLGLVAVIVDPSAGRQHLLRCCRQYAIRGFVGSRKAHLLRLLVPGIRRIPIRWSLGGWVPGARRWRTDQDAEAAAPLAPCEASAPALLTFTSGSTGVPKAVLRTHGLLTAQYHALRRTLDLQPGQVDLATLPIFVLANLAAGVTSIIPEVDLRRPGRVDPALVLRTLERERVTRAGASPAFFERLLTARPAEGWTRVTHLYTGGAPVFPELMTRLQQRAPNSRVVALYGSTEAEPIAHIDAPDAAAAQGIGLPAGRPVPEVTLRVLPDRWGTPLRDVSGAAFEAACLPPGAPGEIVVRGAHVLPGYVDGAGDAETKFAVDGARWHRTGDAGYLDAAGCLWLLGRCAAKVAHNGQVTYPFAIERAAQRQPGIRRAAYVAHRERRWLLIEPMPGDAPDPDAVLRALPPASVDAVRLIDRLPVDRRHNAKIDYPALRRLLDRG